MINIDYITKENVKEHNTNRPQIPHHPYRVLRVGDSGSGITNALLNLISNQRSADKIYLYAKNQWIIIPVTNKQTWRWRHKEF